MESTATRLLFVATVLWMTAGSSVRAEPIGTAFTYQGQLKHGGIPINGTADLSFTLCITPEVGGHLGTTQYETVEVAQGLFTVSLDFGLENFIGDALWLEIEVRFPSGTGDYELLSPRQPITATPYAFALPGLRTQRNGTSPNLIGGYIGNRVDPDVVGATIGGGGDLEDVGPPMRNQVTDHYGTVSGGIGNIAGDSTGGPDTAEAGTVGGGGGNSAGASYATVGGGGGNSATGGYATVAGGGFNYATGDLSTVAGGNLNYAVGDYSAVPGGMRNYAGGDYSFAGGHYARVRDAAATGDANGDEGTFVWADQSGVEFESTGPNQFLIRATGGVGIGTNTPFAHLDVTSDSADKTGFNLRNIASTQRYLFQVNGTNPTGDPNRAGNLEIWGTGLGGNHNVFTATPDGNVGINNASPTNAFSVSGTADFGVVGIGTTTPTANLDVVSAHPAGTAINLMNSDSAQRFLLQINGTGLGQQGNFEIWGTGSGGNHNVFTATTDGKVGIGTTSPTDAFADISLAVGGGHIAIDNGSAVLSVNSTGDSFGAGFDTRPDDALDLYAGGGPRIRLTADGKLGVGTTAPTARLQCNDTQAGTLSYPLKISNTSDVAGTSSGLLFQVDGGGSRGKGAIVYERKGTFNRGDLHILQDPGANTEIADLDDAVVTITNNGSMGIGTTDPTESLDVAGIARAQAFEFESPKTHYFSISAADFMPQYTAGYNRLDGTVPGIDTELGTGNAPPVLAPVHLPHGATITNFKAFIYDIVENHYAAAWLERVQLSNGTLSTMADVQSDDQNPGYSAVSTTAISSAVIDNENYAYYVKAHGVEVGCIGSPPLYCDWPSGIEFMGAVITYTTTEAD